MKNSFFAMYQWYSSVFKLGSVDPDSTHISMCTSFLKFVYGG